MENHQNKKRVVWILSLVVVIILFIIWLFFLPKFSIERGEDQQWANFKKDFNQFLNSVIEQKEILTTKVIPELQDRETVSISENELERLREKVEEFKQDKSEKVNNL